MNPFHAKNFTPAHRLADTQRFFSSLLASKTPLPHNVAMAEVHPFTVKIEADPLRENRYRWTVCEGTQIHLRSPHSYTTRREAEKEAEKAMSNLVAKWRNK
jgi:hypothetical protein